MKKFFKYILLLSFSLILQNQLWGNLTFLHPLSTVIKVATILALFEILLKPIIKILLLPINILTLGLFRIVINTLGFYLAVFLITDFSVGSIYIASQTWQNITIPALQFMGFWSFVVNSTTNNIIFGMFKNIIKPKKEKK